MGGANSAATSHTFFSCAVCSACSVIVTHIRSPLSLAPNTLVFRCAMSYSAPHLSVTPSLGFCTPSLFSTQSSSHVEHPVHTRSSHVMSPSILLNSRITGNPPIFRTMLNTRNFVSSSCSSTNRALRRPTILLKAS